MAQQNSITAIVVTFNSAAVLPDCLAALSRNRVPAIVVDNASEDASCDIARTHGADVIRNGRNEGYGRANNQGIVAAQTKYVLVVNPDLQISNGAVNRLVAAAARYLDAGVLAPRIVEPSGRIFFQPRSLLSPPQLNNANASSIPSGDACVPFVSGACLLFRRDTFLRVGGFDPAIFLFYEDDDLCRRMRDAGHSVIFVDDAVAFHSRGQSTPTSSSRRFRARWHLAWSERYIAEKYGLPAASMWGAVSSIAKTIGYAFALNPRKCVAHAGSVAGALAWRRGASALEREGLSARSRL